MPLSFQSFLHASCLQVPLAPNANSPVILIVLARHPVMMIAPSPASRAKGALRSMTKVGSAEIIAAPRRAPVKERVHEPHRA